MKKIYTPHFFNTHTHCKNSVSTLTPASPADYFWRIAYNSYLPIRFFVAFILLLSMNNVYAQTAPGGVSSGLVLWMKADAGFKDDFGNIYTPADDASVSTWADQSFTSSDLVAGGVYPLYVQSCTNYNPGVFYDAYSYHAADGSITVSNSTMFLVGKPSASSSGNEYRIPWGGGSQLSYPLTIKSGELGYYSTSDLGNTIGTSSNYLWGDDEPSFARAQIYSNNDVDISKLGGPSNTLTGVAGSASSDVYYYLGSALTADNYDASGFGNINETIVYNTADMTTTDIRKVESYLGLKYGFTLDNSEGGTAGNYILSNGTTVWDASEHPEFHHDVIALVRDDESGLLQKQSRTKDDKLRIFLDDLAVDNISNNGTISTNHSSLIISNDEGTLHDDGNTIKPTGIHAMIARKWKITNTNFTDNYSIEVKWDSMGTFRIEDIRFLVSNSPDMSNATVYDGNSLNFRIGSIIVGGINQGVIHPNTTMYVAIGSASASTTLPIIINAFNAKVLNNSKVNLSWQTTAEHGNNYFIVEKSKDGVQWQSLTKINSLGDAFGIQTYSAVDNEPYNGTSYYRLQQVDLNGHFQYTGPRIVKIDKSLDNPLVLFPNPVLKQLTIKGSEDEIKTIRVFSMSGADVSNNIKIISRDSKTVVLDLSSLIKGSYQVKTATSTHQIVKQ